jgi:hypothetical protein
MSDKIFITPDWSISPTQRLRELPKNPTLEYKIDLFFNITDGWQLNIAEQMINGKKDESGRRIDDGIPHSAFAVLSVVFSYFEAIAKYESGYTKEKGHPKKYFKIGVFSVFPELKDSTKFKEADVKKFSDGLYEYCRCGLYHTGLPTDRLLLTYQLKGSIGYLKSENLVINPHLLVPDLRTHLLSYVSKLKDKKNTRLRMRFEARFNVLYPRLFRTSSVHAKQAM